MSRRKEKPSNSKQHDTANNFEHGDNYVFLARCIFWAVVFTSSLILFFFHVCKIN